MHTRIRDVRKQRGLTLAEVAGRCRPATTAQTIGRLETGMRTVSVGWLNRIAAALGVPPSELVTLPDRADVPVAAILGAQGAVAPADASVLSPPVPAPDDVALRVEAGHGDYRAGDIVWLTRLPAERFGDALNRDVLAPRGAGRFAFGRLLAVDGPRLHLLPLSPGARQIVIAEAPWVGVVRTLIRDY
jgi:transcriptional regulator with XRE-family HTH domain